IEMTYLPDTISSGTFRFTGAFDPAVNYLKIGDFRDTLNRRLYTGIYMNLASSRVYPLIGSFRFGQGDSAILETSGVVQYDEAKRRYLIGPEERILNGGLK